MRFPKQVWLTGSHGFIGSALMERLKAEGVKVIRVGRTCGEVVSDPKDCVVHAGWLTTDPNSPAHLSECLPATMALIDRCRNLRTPLIFLGSHNEYGTRCGTILEDDPPEGHLNLYALAKLAATRYGLQYDRFICLRPTFVYGIGMKPGSLPLKVIAWAKQGRCDLGYCGFHRQYLHVSDLVEAIMRVLNAPGGIYNVHAPGWYWTTIQGFAQAIWEQLKMPLDTLTFSDKRPVGTMEHDAEYTLNTDKLAALGWKPKVQIDQGIAELIASTRC